MKTKVKNTVIGISILAIGYIAGAVIGYPALSGDMTNGDISKVSMFRKAVMEPQYSAFEAKLMSDSLAFQEEDLTKEILALKLQEFANLVDSSIIVAGNIPELQEQVNALREVKEMSVNAAKAGEAAQASFENLQNGNKENLGISYEQASQNMAIAYMLIDKQVGIGKAFAIAADQYYVKHNDLKDLASIRDSWALFCCENAILGGNEEEQKYWASNSSNVHFSNSQLIKVLNNKGGDLIGKQGDDLIGKQGDDLIGKQGDDLIGKQGDDLIGKLGEDIIGKLGEDIIGKLEVNVISDKVKDYLGQKTTDAIGHRIPGKLGKNLDEIGD